MCVRETGERDKDRQTFLRVAGKLCNIRVVDAVDQRSTYNIRRWPRPTDSMNMQSEAKWRVTSTRRGNLKEKLKTKENYFRPKKKKNKKRNENILKTGAKLIKLMLGFWASSQAVGKYLHDDFAEYNL